MTRNPDTGKVTLARGEWLKLASGVLGALATLVGSAWHFSVDVSNQLTELRVTVKALEHRITTLEQPRFVHK